MSVSIEQGQRYELRDAAGTTIGVFVPEPVLPALTAERDALRKQLAEQADQLATLRRDLAEVQKERDEYLQALECVSRDRSLLIDERELADLQRNGIDLADIVAEIEQMREHNQPGARDGQ